MIYTLNFVSKFGLWELKINHFRIRFYTTRDEAMKCVTRYRQMLKSEEDRYERKLQIERESFEEMRYQSDKEIR